MCFFSLYNFFFSLSLYLSLFFTFTYTPSLLFSFSPSFFVSFIINMLNFQCLLNIFDGDMVFLVSYQERNGTESKNSVCHKVSSQLFFWATNFFCAFICFPFCLVMIHFPGNDDAIHIDLILRDFGNFAVILFQLCRSCIIFLSG